MPNITLTWQPYYTATTQQYGTNNWIFQAVWSRNDDSSYLLTVGGLYVIEDTNVAVASPVYAGKATNLRNRFQGRSDAMRDFRLSYTGVNPVNNRRVWLARVNPFNQLGIAEKWLIRVLYKADQQTFLQNVNATKPLTVPSDGLDIQNVNKPACIDFASYSYNPGTKV